MVIRLDRDIVNPETGEVEPTTTATVFDTSTAFLERLRQIERTIVLVDDQLDQMAGELKATRAERERLVRELRTCIRQGAVLPLFEGIPDLDEAS